MAKKTKAAPAAKKARERDALEHRNSMDRARMAREAVDSNGRALTAERLQTTVEMLESARADYLAECAKLKPTSMMPQRLVALALVSDSLLDTLSSIKKTFNETALTLRRKGGFEPGPCRVTFVQSTGYRRPAWKDEAVAKARQLAAARGKKFNEKRYVERVTETTERAPDSYKPVIEVEDD